MFRRMRVVARRAAIRLGALGPLATALPATLVGQSVDGAAFTAWQEAEVAAQRYAPLQTAVAGRVTLAVLPVGGVPSANRRDLLSDAAKNCAAPLDLDDGEVNTVTEWRPWALLDEDVRDTPVITLSVLPTAPRPALCGPVRAGAAAAAANGVLFTADSLPLLFRRLARVEVWIDGAQVQPLAEATAPTLRVTRWGVDPLPQSQYRAHLRPELFGPLADGSSPAVELRIWVDRETAPAAVVVPPEVVRDAFQASLPWRAAALSAQPPASELPISLPVPSDEALQSSRAAFRSGAHAAASMQALARLGEATPLSQTDVLAARVQLGVTYAAYGDDPAARSVLTPVMRAEPCLRLPNSAPLRVRTLMNELRPADSCQSVSLGAAFTRALVPGAALRGGSPSRQRLGRYVFAAAVTSAAVATFAAVRSSQLYDQYGTEVADPAGVWQQAESHRSLANGALAALVVTWGGSILEAMYRASRRRAELQPRTSYGARASKEFGPVDGGKEQR